jgi:hypothetical protein
VALNSEHQRQSAPKAINFISIRVALNSEHQRQSAPKAKFHLNQVAQPALVAHTGTGGAVCKGATPSVEQ